MLEFCFLCPWLFCCTSMVCV